MSILDEVLIEEYGRCERIKNLYQKELAAASSEGVRRKYEQKIEAVEFDQKKIRAALDVAGIDIEKVFRE